jgi:hypothetical protein
MDAVLEHPFFNFTKRDEIVRQNSITTGTRGGGGKKTVAKTKSATNLMSELYSDGSYAVIIAINDYESAGIPVNDGGMRNLSSAVDDAKAIEERLLARGFNKVYKLYNSDATKDGIDDLLGEVEDDLDGKTNARLVFFLASHGLVIKGDAYICCYGTKQKRYRNTCLKMQSLKDFAKNVDAKHQLYLLDCCHSGGLFVGTRGQPTKYQLKLMGSPAVYGITSVSASQEALEANGHGLFTKAILSALDGQAPQFSREQPSEYITANELYSFVSKYVFETSTEIYDSNDWRNKSCLCGKTYGECKECRQTPKFQPLLQSHKEKSCDGQFLFFRKEEIEKPTRTPKEKFIVGLL